MDGAIAEALRSGHASWLPPHDPAPLQTVYAYFARCRRDVKDTPPPAAGLARQIGYDRRVE
ncbi:MAG: hypothetical protein M3R02_25080 [Chloroflexota bacterium]|nr:hypothetical protein [Chloroflexota bacterium]